MRRLFTLIILLSLLSFTPVLAEEPASPMAETSLEADLFNDAELRERYANEIRAISHYLSSFKTFSSRFVQVGENGQRGKGEVWIQRPGKARWEYRTPAPVMLLIRDNKLTYYDYLLEEVTYADVPDTPLNILLYSSEDPLKNATIHGIEATRNSIRIVLSAETDNEDWKNAMLILSFDRNPMQLKRAIQFDPANKALTLDFINPTLNQPLPDKRFIFIDPRKNKPYPTSR